METLPPDSSDVLAQAKPESSPPNAPRMPDVAASWPLVTVVALIAAWSYWPVFVEMADKWVHDPQYSHGYLVPAFSLFLALRAWKTSRPWDRASSWWGTAFIAAGMTLRLVGTRWYVDWLEAISLLPMLAGAVLLMGSWEALWRLSPAIAFLAFMVPLPYRIETGLSQPLQRYATAGATFVLQTLGRPAFAEGNVIVLNDLRIGIVEACSGLGMFLLFFATAVAVAMLIRRPFWHKLVVVLSAAPIAVGVNILRIVMTSLVHEAIGEHWFNATFHDVSGWLMMPMAIVALLLVSWMMDRLIIEVEVPLKPRVNTDPAQLRPVPHVRSATRPRASRRHLPETTP